VSLNGQGHNDDFFAYNSGNLDLIQGPLAIHGNNIYNNFIVNDYLNPEGHTYMLSASGPTSTLTRDGIEPITFDGVGQLVLYVPRVGYNHLNVQSTPANLYANLTASNGDVDVAGSLAPNLGGTMANIQGGLAVGFESVNVTAPVSLTLDDSTGAGAASRRVTVGLAIDSPAYASTFLTNLAGNGQEVLWRLPAGSVANVLGRPGGNLSFAMQTFEDSALPTIRASGNNNTLDYSAYPNDVTVNLRMGTATALAGISGIQNVTGGQGNNLLVGNGQNNTLTGGQGRNLLIGGAGPATLIGGPSDNILIAGYTDYDTNVDALTALMAEWTRTGSNSDFATRVQDLMNGVGPSGQYKLTAQTVHSAGAPNSLTGGGQNGFFLTPEEDSFFNSHSGDLFTYV
jgi:hypothetical protein